MNKPKARTKKVGAIAGKKRPGTKRRKRVSGIDIEAIGLKVVALGGGAIAARLSNTILVKQFPTLTPMISGAIQIAAGVALPMFVKAPWAGYVGSGMIANGVMVEAVTLGVISGGVHDGGRTLTYRINGTSNLSAIGRAGRKRKQIGGTANLSAVGGTANLSAVGSADNRTGSHNIQPNGVGRMRF